MVRLSFPLIAFTSALAACTPAEEAAIMTLVNPVLDGGTYSTGGGITVAAEVRPIAGMTGLCGVWAESERQAVFTKRVANRVIHSGAAYFDGDVLHRDLGFMRKVAPGSGFVGASANCIQTARPWSDADQGKQLKLRIPRQVVHREIDDGRGGGFIVTFKQTGPGTPGATLKSLILDN